MRLLRRQTEQHEEIAGRLRSQIFAAELQVKMN